LRDVRAGSAISKLYGVGFQPLFPVAAR